MKQQLTDIVRHAAPMFDTLICEGTTDNTKFSAMSPDKSIIFNAQTTSPISDLVGTSAFANLSLLLGLLEFSSYNTDESTMAVTRSDDGSRVSGFEFKDGSRKSGAIYRSKNPSMVPEEDWPPSVAEIKWQTQFEPQKSKLSEFSKLASLYGEIEKVFMPRTEDNDLMFVFGDDGSSNHRASMIFQENIAAEIKGDIRYKVSDFQNVLKILAKDSAILHLTSRGVIMLGGSNDLAKYSYIIRAVR